ncbi:MULTISPECIES: DUF6615 family protein [Nocardiaceae]|uniref:Uncharacterized protein n=1 Tax=Rhodococcoides corynebacterioides TaxID=53972 RepID=A0ABS2KWH0_9NOCA|nr:MULTISPECIES: DUF6615 family protein [Rhodococcus]MBM7416261.1 hypothetical protein [Rhodococcus corynebacterioides]MBP1114514.1 hypothetical protein [Rhodococcus sp. PvP016]
MKQSLPGLNVKKFDRHEEKGNGADWEWWIGSSTERRWIKLRVQAKRSSHAGNQYAEIGRKPKGSPFRQYDTLIAASIRDRAIPLHVFYNGWPENRFKVAGKYHDVIARHRRAARDGFHPSSAWDTANWGCSIAATENVKKIHEDPTISDFPRSLVSGATLSNLTYVPLYLIHSVPWALLLDSGGNYRGPTVREVAQNLHLIQNGDGTLTNDEFERMTYPNPSEAAQALEMGEPGPEFDDATDGGREQRVDQAVRYLQSLEYVSRDPIGSNISRESLDAFLPSAVKYMLTFDLARLQSF